MSSTSIYTQIFLILDENNRLVHLLAYLPNLPYSRGIGVRRGIRAPGRRMGVMDIMLGCVGDRFLYGDNVSNLYKSTNLKRVGVINKFWFCCRVMGGSEATKWDHPFDHKAIGNSQLAIKRKKI